MSAPVFIGSRAVGPGQPPFVVLEAGINHNGELERAVRMIEVARDCGADAVKFQTFKAKEFVGDPNLTFSYKSQGRDVTESMLAMFERMEFSASEWAVLKRACDAAGIMFLSTPQNVSDLAILLPLGIPAIKVGSDDFNNLPLLREYSRPGLPLILSCGMADMEEVARSLDAVSKAGNPSVILLVCTSSYPTPPADANVRRLTTLRDAFPGLVLGFSDHTEGPEAAAIAAALGATFFEKHFTLDHDLPGPDHWFSEDPDGARAWIAAIRKAYVLLGDGVVRPTAAEVMMKRIARRSVTALTAIAPGEIFSSQNIGLRRPGTGLGPERWESVLGRRSSRPIPVGRAIVDADIE